MPRYQKDVKEAAVRRYAQGVPASTIALDVGCRHETVLDWVDRAATPRVPVRVSDRKARALPADVLTREWVTTEAGAWAIGLFVSDGSLRQPAPTSAHSRNSPRLRVSLASRDADGVLAFARALGLDGSDLRTTSIGGRSQTFVELAHPRLRDLFCHTLGFVPGSKIGTARLPDMLDHDARAWRGVIDGDGYVCLDAGRGPRPSLTLGLRNHSEALHRQFATFTTDRAGVQPLQDSARSRVTGLAAVRLIDELYGDATYTIARKREKALALRDEFLERRRIGDRGAPPTRRQADVLRSLAAAGQATSSELIRQRHRAPTRSNVAGMRNSLAALERRGLIRAARGNGHAGRSYQLTPAGARALEVLDA
jgi:hypothetical protein